MANRVAQTCATFMRRFSPVRVGQDTLHVDGNIEASIPKNSHRPHFGAFLLVRDCFQEA